MFQVITLYLALRRISCHQRSPPPSVNLEIKTALNDRPETGSTICNSNLSLVVDKYENHSHSDLNIKERIDRWIQNSEVLLQCPVLLNGFKTDHVPNLVHRIWECRQVPTHYFPALNTWIDNMEGVLVFLWTAELRARFMQQHGTKEQVQAYERIRPGAFKADFFRYLVLYHFGGVYSDIDTFLEMNLSPEKDLDYLYATGSTMAYDLDPTRLLNGAILMALPRQPIFRCALGEIADHTERRKTKSEILNPLDVTGPGVLGECARHVLGMDELKFDEDILTVSNSGLRILPSVWLSDGSGHVVLLENHTIIRMMPGGASYPDERTSPACDPGEHYSVLHSKNMLYTDEKR